MFIDVDTYLPRGAEGGEGSRVRPRSATEAVVMGMAGWTLAAGLTSAVGAANLSPYQHAAELPLGLFGLRRRGINIT